MSSSSSIFGSDEDLGFSSASNGTTGRMIEDITRNIHLTASSTTLSLVNNKACVGVSSSNEAPDLEAEERAERVKEN